MTFELYRDLHLLINEQISNNESRIEDYMRGLTELDSSDSDSEYVYLGKRIAKHKAKIYELEQLLARFETEVEEPKH